MAEWIAWPREGGIYPELPRMVAFHCDLLKTRASGALLSPTYIPMRWSSDAEAVELRDCIMVAMDALQDGRDQQFAFGIVLDGGPWSEDIAMMQMIATCMLEEPRRVEVMPAWDPHVLLRAAMEIYVPFEINTYIAEVGKAILRDDTFDEITSRIRNRLSTLFRAERDGILTVHVLSMPDRRLTIQSDIKLGRLHQNAVLPTVSSKITVSV